MANSFEVVDLVTKEALRIAHEKLTMIGTVDRQYDATFRYDSNRGKFGQTLRVRMPNQYTRRKGSRVMAVQDQDEASQNITLATQDGVDMRFNSVELIQSVNNGAAFDDLSKNYIEPAVAVLCSGIEGDAIEYWTKKVWNVAGSAGTAMTTLAYPGAARAKLNQNLAPKSDRNIQIDSVTMGGLVNGVATYFAPSEDIGRQYREGFVKRTAMADYYENERLWTLTNSADVTANTNAAAGVTDGGSTINVSTDLAQALQVVGSVFTVAGVYQCHPETKAGYPHLQQFVVTATGATAVTVSPTIHLTGAKQNMCTSSGGTLVVADFNAKALTFLGAASTSYVQPLMYQKEAFQFVTADLPLMDDAQKCVRRTHEGLAIRVWMGSDIRNDELLMRLDILYGFAALRPEWACRIIGAAN